MSTEVDHLVIAADSLAQGRAWCERTLGVQPVAGGHHALMGTHNLLLSLSSSRYRRAYLEIIAIDPDAAPPGRPRWFGLDGRPKGEPSLVQIVARSSHLEQQRQALIHLGIDPGSPLALSRGHLHWQMLLRPDGQMPSGFPMLIQWGDQHPADVLPDSGCSLLGVKLCGLGPSEAQALRLQNVELEMATQVNWKVQLNCPLGVVDLCSATLM